MHDWAHESCVCTPFLFSTRLCGLRRRFLFRDSTQMLLQLRTHGTCQEFSLGVCRSKVSVATQAISQVDSTACSCYFLGMSSVNRRIDVCTSPLPIAAVITNSNPVPPFVGRSIYFSLRSTCYQLYHLYDGRSTGRILNRPDFDGCSCRVRCCIATNHPILHPQVSRLGRLHHRPWYVPRSNANNPHAVMPALWRSEAHDRHYIEG